MHLNGTGFVECSNPKVTILTASSVPLTLVLDGLKSVGIFVNGTNFKARAY